MEKGEGEAPAEPELQHNRSFAARQEPRPPASWSCFSTLLRLAVRSHKKAAARQCLQVFSALLPCQELPVSRTEAAASNGKGICKLRLGSPIVGEPRSA